MSTSGASKTVRATGSDPASVFVDCMAGAAPESSIYALGGAGAAAHEGPAAAAISAAVGAVVGTAVSLNQCARSAQAAGHGGINPQVNDPSDNAGANQNGSESQSDAYGAGRASNDAAHHREISPGARHSGVTQNDQGNRGSLTVRTRASDPARVFVDCMTGALPEIGVAALGGAATTGHEGPMRAAMAAATGAIVGTVIAIDQCATAAQSVGHAGINSQGNGPSDNAGANTNGSHGASDANGAGRESHDAGHHSDDSSSAGHFGANQSGQGGHGAFNTGHEDSRESDHFGSHGLCMPEENELWAAQHSSSESGAGSFSSGHSSEGGVAHGSDHSGAYDHSQGGPSHDSGGHSSESSNSHDNSGNSHDSNGGMHDTSSMSGTGNEYSNGLDSGWAHDSGWTGTPSDPQSGGWSSHDNSGSNEDGASRLP